MSWESSVSAESSLLNTPCRAIPCTRPATPWKGSTRTWCASQWDQERPSIRSPRRMGSANGNFSLQCPVNLPGLQCPKTSQPAPQPGWEVKAFCRCAAVWGPQPPAMERPTKFQPLRSTPSPSVKMGRKSRGQERSEGRGVGGGRYDLRHPPHFLLGRPVHSSWMTRQDQDTGDNLGMGWGKRPNSQAVGRAQGRRRMSHSHPAPNDDKQHFLEANALAVILWGRFPRLALASKNTMGNRMSYTIQKTINIRLWFHHEYFEHTL